MKRFNLRVYGLLINNQQQILISDELIKGKWYTKFPGGGVEFGEGLRDALAREFMEETNLAIEVGSHFYTTDFCQPSYFDTQSQIIAVYYFVTVKGDMPTIKNQSEQELFRWIDIKNLTAETMSLPIDKIVAIALANNGNH